MTDKYLQQLATRVGEVLIARREMLALAESCTGGWIGQVATAVTGSSAWFERGFVTYSNLAKTQMLDVPADLIRDQGAVSEAVVLQMASGALRNSVAQWSISVSGVAGPDGGSAHRPVGTVWIAWGGQQTGAEAHCFHFSGNREAVRRETVQAGLQGLLDRLG